MFVGRECVWAWPFVCVGADARWWLPGGDLRVALALCGDLPVASLR